MKEKRGEMNKRGQEGVTITTLLLIVLGVVVVVVIILGATGGLNFVFEKFKIIPGQSLQAVVESCQIAAQAKLTADYCSEFKKVKFDTGSEYINCLDSRVEQNMKPEISRLDCPQGGPVLIQTKCEDLIIAKYGGRTYKNFEEFKTTCDKFTDKVNGVLCSGYCDNARVKGNIKIA